jgi:hypothetical protein
MYTAADHDLIHAIEANIRELRTQHPLNAQVNLFLTSALHELDMADRYIQWQLDNQ